MRGLLYRSVNARLVIQPTVDCGTNANASLYMDGSIGCVNIRGYPNRLRNIRVRLSSSIVSLCHLRISGNNVW